MDRLYLMLTGVRVTDPSEARFTFGNFRTRRYDKAVIETLGLSHRRKLLPEILDGARTTHPPTRDAALQTGLRAGTPVALGCVDMAMTAFGAGVCGGGSDVACSTIGSTGVHMRAVAAQAVPLNAAGTGYVVPLPVPDVVAQAQTNMAATLNLDWMLALAGDLLREAGHGVTHRNLVNRIEGWLQVSGPGRNLRHPYISEAGERGPFVDAEARAGFPELSFGHRYPDLVRAVVEGLGLAMRDCYVAMGDLPAELRLAGGASRSRGLRSVLAASVGAPVRVSARAEAGAAGAAMMAAVAIGAYPDMDACVTEWVTPLFGPSEPPDPALVELYGGLVPAFIAARDAMRPVLQGLAATRRTPVPSKADPRQGACHE